MYFIILTTPLRLYPHNERNIECSCQVAEPLNRLAGPVAATFHTVGLIGVGLLAIPILAGSSAYAFAETLAWKQGLDKPVRSARYFYGVISVSTLLGIAMLFVKISPIKALFGASVINGVLAPFLLVGILVVASDRKLMERQPSPWLSRIVVGLTAAIMLIAAGAMFFFVRLSAHVICGRLFSHPCGNLICCAFSRDLLRLSSGHLCLACSLSPMRVARLPCC